MINRFCMLVVIFMFVVILNHSLCGCHICNHEVSEFSHDVILKRIGSKSRRDVYTSFHFHLYYDESINALPQNKRNFIKNDLMPVAIRYWEKTVEIKSFNSNIKILRQCVSDRVRYKDNDSYPFCVDGCSNLTYCGEVVVPTEHLEKCRHISVTGEFNTSDDSGIGVSDGHFILYVSAFESNRCHMENTIAYAAYCRLEASLDRPVAGYVNMCPDEISLKMFDLHQMYFTIKHEILHALGFSSGLFAFYRDKHGQPLTPRNPATNKPPYNKIMNRYQWSEKVIRTIERSDWLVAGGYVNRTFHYVVTPSVVREVRSHFNCSLLEGAELENQGPLGTSFTHWEKRIFENELMTGTYTQNLVISRITLALLEDTGWYQVNYEMAGELKWGKNLGCLFARTSCSQWILYKINRNESIHPYCNQLKTNAIKTECTEDLSSVGVCNLIMYDDQLPLLYRNVLNLTQMTMDMMPYFGGSVPLADYCPYIQEFNWKENEKTIRGSKCLIEDNNPSDDMNLLLETYGSKSICIEHASKWTVQHCSSVHEVDNWGSGCYQLICAQNKLGLIVNKEFHWCYNKNDVIQISIVSSYWLHKGSLLCPDFEKLCWNFTTESFSIFPYVQIMNSTLDIPCSSCFMIKLFNVIYYYTLIIFYAIKHT